MGCNCSRPSNCLLGDIFGRFIYGPFILRAKLDLCCEQLDCLGNALIKGAGTVTASPNPIQLVCTKGRAIWRLKGREQLKCLVQHVCT